MIRLRKKTAAALVVALVLGLLAVTPAFAAEIPDEEIIRESNSVCRSDGTVEVTYTNYYDAQGAYFMACTGEPEPDCQELGWLNWGETSTGIIRAGTTCVAVLVGYCEAAVAVEEVSLLAVNGCTPIYNFQEPVEVLCSREGWPACPAACEGGAGLYPPSNSGVPYNGYNESGYFILVVDNHCDQYVDTVGIYIGDPLAEITQVMSLPVDPNGWTQFSEDDIMGIRDMYDYEGEIWFKVPIIGDRYYGLHELMTHPNLGSGD